MTPAHTIRTAFAAAIAATFAVGFLTVAYRGPLQGGVAATPIAAHRDGATLQSLLTGPLNAPLLQSRPTRVSEAAPSRLGSPCLHNQRQQLVAVSIERQHAWACSGRHTVLSTPVTTGRSQPGDRTPRGSFAVEARVANTTLRPAAGGKVHVTYWIPFRQNVWGFHDAPWQTMPFGSSHYVTQGSIGCVHVPINALRKLFGWVHDGTTVQIR